MTGINQRYSTKICKYNSEENAVSASFFFSWLWNMNVDFITFGRKITWNEQVVPTFIIHSLGFISNGSANNHLSATAVSLEGRVKIIEY